MMSKETIPPPRKYKKSEIDLIQKGEYDMAKSIYKLTGLPQPKDDADAFWYYHEIKKYIQKDEQYSNNWAFYSIVIFVSIIMSAAFLS